MIDVTQVACVVPTRGDVDLGPVLDDLPFSEIGVWDNSADDDLGVYGRYAAVERVDAPVIFTQDDDCVLPPATVDALLAAYQPGMVVCNVPERFRGRYRDSGLVGFGAVFDRWLPGRAFQLFGWHAFDRVLDGDLPADVFLRTCDLVFTMLTPMLQLDLPYTDLAYARADSRMWRQPGHFDERDRMRKVCREIRERVPA